MCIFTHIYVYTQVKTHVYVPIYRRLLPLGFRALRFRWLYTHTYGVWPLENKEHDMEAGTILWDRKIGEA